MPGGDGTGPRGMGPMTGRAAGFCVGNNAPGYAAPGFGGGRGFGFGRGRGRGGFGGGWGRRNRGGWQGGAWSAVDVDPTFPPVQPTREEQVQAMRKQVERYETSLRNIRGRIEELERETGEQA